MEIIDSAVAATRLGALDYVTSALAWNAALAEYAPVVVIGKAERETCLNAQIAAGVADYVPRSEACMSDALDLMEHRLTRRPQIAESVPAKAAREWSKDFAEVLRDELNNPLTGILGNAELLLAEIAVKRTASSHTGGWKGSRPLRRWRCECAQQ